MGKRKAGRPKDTTPETKKIVLDDNQKRYAKMIRDVDTDLAKAKARIDELDKELATKRDERQKLDIERQNLEGAKRNLEGILSQIPPPPRWADLTRIVYEYHHHHHYPYPIYIGPWWQYYWGGSYITYPAQSTIMGIGSVTSGLTNVSAPQNDTVIYGTADGGGQFTVHNSNLSGLHTLQSDMSAVSSSFVTDGGQPNTLLTGSAGSTGNVDAAEATLRTIGFFDTETSGTGIGL